jgi:hypothetical protein
MEPIKSTRILHKKIKQILESTSEDLITFPQVLMYNEGIGRPTFVLTIEKNEENFYVDDQGQKWIKA